jgi:hypothetical protein
VGPSAKILFGVLATLASAALAADLDRPDNPDINPENVAAFFDTAFSVQQQEHELVGTVVSVGY